MNPSDPYASRYPYDPHVHRAVARLLYRLLPALYRVKDLGPSVPREDSTGNIFSLANIQARFLRDLHELADDATPQEMPEHLPRGTADLYRLLRVLAAPFAVLRQNVDELHADLFVDRSGDAMLPLLAGQVGSRLVFKDADDDRADLRGTVAWRRRKGTRSMLEDMASALLHRRVVTQEGWSRLLVSQDLNLLRPERGACDVRSPELADTCAGPYDAAFHALDARRPTATTGRYHPKHVTHWTHATTMFPVRRGTPGPGPQISGLPALSRRYAFHPAGAEAPLRVRADYAPVLPPFAVSGNPVAAYEAPTDRVPASLFAAHPERYFDDRSGPSAKFSVRILGLPAAVASSQPMPGAPSPRPASRSLYSARVNVDLLRRGEGALGHPVEVTVCRVPFKASAPNEPDVALAEMLGGVRVRAAAPESIAGANPTSSVEAVAMVRLRPAVGAGAAYFPGAFLAVTGTTSDARRASEDPQLARMGFLHGALHVEVPATWVWEERWFYMAADGSLYDAQNANEPGSSGHAVNAAVIRAGGVVSLPNPVRAIGPGPAWPPTLSQSTYEPMTALPPPLGQGPAFVHAARALVDETGVQAEGLMRLVFARADPEGRVPETFMSLSWNAAADPVTTATWEVLDAEGEEITDRNEVLERWKNIAAQGSGACALWLECETAGIVLPPCELAFTDAHGQAVLLCVPELTSFDRPESFMFPSEADAVSEAFQVMRDGSTRGIGGGDEGEGEAAGEGEDKGGRYALGPVIPLPGPATVRRREVRGRRLCAWRNETAGVQLDATESGRLDVDAEHGLFAMSLDDAVPNYLTPGTAWPPAAPVTVNYQDGFTDHIGARSDARGPELDTWVRMPTRIVSSTGRTRQSGPSGSTQPPEYATLSDAFAAITASPHTESFPTPEGPVVKVVEVVEFDDSATYYEASSVAWPSGVNSLTVQAAESERPVIRINGSMTWPTQVYEELILLGLSFDMNAVETPQATRTTVQFCSSARAGCRWILNPRDDVPSEVVISRCHLGGITLQSAGMAKIDRSVLHASTVEGLGITINAPAWRVELDRCTVSKGEGGADECVRAKVLEASEVLFTHPIEITDRFSGCVRYSRVAPGSLTPRRFRVTEAPPRFASLDFVDAAHLRLATDAPEAILHGAEDGGEIGAFHDTGLTRRAEGLLRRLMEFTPAGLITGVIRQD
ncbi:MAG: hypothetical protein JWM10_3165 [Myxococcaceae bacterium]|nr:hypothetical protein [Myxococcaceae bacterium]